MVTYPLRARLTFTGPGVGGELETGGAGAGERTVQVLAEILAVAVLERTLVLVCKQVTRESSQQPRVSHHSSHA